MSHAEGLPVLRAPMRSRLDEVDAAAAVERALALGLCGIGGRLARAPADLAEACALVAEQHDERTARRLERFAAEPAGAFVWTRTGEGLFAVGRLTGPWRYDASADARALDLVHVRDCAWAEALLPAAQTPAPVLATFARGGRNLQRVHDGGVAAASARAVEAQDRRGDRRRMGTGSSR
ncbi:GAF domain-containing protein [Actinotalea sp. BY-33]|uniref:GAF domain-containing protein n=1 Tax=Actinotalea soli TaxID=2819234 RepID=A0A939RUR9_9CELL|nr:GAF domain-containing protein [Actinotalea soli]MBO1751645.1 GAF domain-containing protein [Actinotalea soli]